MTVQIAVKLDDGLAEQVRAAAADAGARRGGRPRASYSDEQESALAAARRRRVR